MACKLFRTGLSAPCDKTIYRDMPNVDKLLHLVYLVYMSRECGDFVLEEDLFAILLFLYRSPETMIKCTYDPETRNKYEQSRMPRRSMYRKKPYPKPSLTSAIFTPDLSLWHNM